MRLRLVRRRRPPPNLRMLPNALTTLALCAGMNAIRYAIQSRWEAAIIAIAIAAVLDMLDGRTARLLHAQSRFGAELDSLSDVVCFGITPAILLYLWSLHGAGNFGWIATLSFGICAALRLARYNAGLTATGAKAVPGTFFVGVPTPAGAGLALMPVMASFELGPIVPEHPRLVALWTIGIALLMVSRLPTLSFSAIRIRHGLRLPLLAALGISAGAAVDEPWVALLALGGAYLVSVPMVALRYRSAAAASNPAVTPEPAATDGTA